MTEYKWTLRKGSKKEICPKCGQRRFVPYVLASDGVTLADEMFGRCDRENNCGYHCYPTSDVHAVEAAINVQACREIEPIRFYPAAVHVNTQTNLFEYVAKLVGIQNALDAWTRYRVGAIGDRTIFWQIDRRGEIHAGKSIPYGKDGHRIKTDKFPANWLHRDSSWSSWHTGRDLEQCYFGEHLICDDSHIALVESEKTAIVMSCVFPKFVWVASGGSQNVKNEQRNAALRGHDVFMIPDHGEFFSWKTIAEREGWRIADTIERFPCFEGCDILDCFENGDLNDDGKLEFIKK